MKDPVSQFFNLADRALCFYLGYQATAFETPWGTTQHALSGDSASSPNCRRRAPVGRAYVSSIRKGKRRVV